MLNSPLPRNLIEKQRLLHHYDRDDFITEMMSLLHHYDSYQLLYLAIICDKIKHDLMVANASVLQRPVVSTLVPDK